MKATIDTKFSPLAILRLSRSSSTVLVAIAFLLTTASAIQLAEDAASKPAPGSVVTATRIELQLTFIRMPCEEAARFRERAGGESQSQTASQSGAVGKAFFDKWRTMLNVQFLGESAILTSNDFRVQIRATNLIGKFTASRAPRMVKEEIPGPASKSFNEPLPPTVEICSHLTPDRHHIELNSAVSVCEFRGFDMPRSTMLYDSIDTSGRFTPPGVERTLPSIFPDGARSLDNSSSSRRAFPMREPFPIPSYSLRHVDASLVIKEGETAILCDLPAELNVHEGAGPLPVLGDLPWTDRLVRSEHGVNYEVLILVTPRILD